MDTLNKSIRYMATMLCLVMASMLFSSPALSELYRGKIRKIETNLTTGDIIIQIKPGTSENGFEGKALVMLAGTDTGTNRAMATLLTAMSLGSEIDVDVPNPPSFDNIQTITNLILRTP